MSTLLVGTHADVLRVDRDAESVTRGSGLDAVTPTCVATEPGSGDRAWCGTREDGLFTTDDGGRSWHPTGLGGRHIMSVTVSPATRGLIWAGTEPSEVWRSYDGGRSWSQTAPLDDLPSAPRWSFPPRPETHHVRWIASHPERAGTLWVAIEAGALVTSDDGGESWMDRVDGGPYDTHELAIHPNRPERLLVAAGDGFFESPDGGESWSQPDAGLDVGYLRSIAIDPGDPDVVVVSAASRARSAYSPRGADGRLYRRDGTGEWKRVTQGWPDPPTTIAPLLTAGASEGMFWAADERGVHHCADGGRSWRCVVSFEPHPHHLRGLAVFAAE